jgi:hypothetical protein
MNPPFQAQPEPEKQNPALSGRNNNGTGKLTTPAQGSSSRVPDWLDPQKPNDPDTVPRYYRGFIDGANSFPDDSLLDAAILHYEFDKRRRTWWETRRWILYTFALLTPLFLIVGLIALATRNSLSGLLIIGAVASLVLFLLTLLYSWWTLPRIISFGRVYRRFVGVPLERGGLVWNDPVVPPPDFPGLRDNFFALYRDSDEIGQRIRPDDDEETSRKKRTISELIGLIAPLRSAASTNSTTPYVQAESTISIDRCWLQPLDERELTDVFNQTLPLTPQPGQAELLEQLTREVEDYSSLDDRSGQAIESQNATIHNQIAEKVAQNLDMVASEMRRWQERAEREKVINSNVLSRFQLIESAVSEAFTKVENSLENEVRPALQRLEAESAYYRSQTQRYYSGLIEAVEYERDGTLAKLDNEHRELTSNQEERLDEQGLLQAELKRLNDQRVRLDNSTNNRFEGLKTQLTDLTERSYNLPQPPHFRSDYNELPTVQESEEVLRQLTQLRADARLGTSDVNDALNRYARLRFDPLDELGRLKQQISAGTKWQATAWLGNLINFRQSGQLLAIAGDVSEAVSVYLDFASEFERLNRQWCSLAYAVRELGATAYNNQLSDAQRHLEALETALKSLHSSLVMAPHSPEMSRPSTFQNLYDLAAGLQRELDELGSLAGSIAHTQERLSELDAELAQFEAQLAQNEAITDKTRHDFEDKLADLQRKQLAILSRLDELKAERQHRIRAHIVELNKIRENEMAKLQAGVQPLIDLNDISEKFLQKHLRLSNNLLEQANSLRQNLELTISSIVQEFERSVHSDRSLRGTSEVFVPVWYLQLNERPFWKGKIIGFASCYSGIYPDNPPGNSFWRFYLTNKPAIHFTLDEDTGLEHLVQVDGMEYPAGEIRILPNSPDWLVENGWVSRWLVKLHRPR